AVPLHAFRLVPLFRGPPRLQPDERGNALRGPGVHRARDRADGAAPAHGQRPAAAVPPAPDLLPLDDLDRGALGGHVPGGHLDARPALPATAVSPANQTQARRYSSPRLDAVSNCY